MATLRSAGFFHLKTKKKEKNLNNIIIIPNLTMPSPINHRGGGCFLGVSSSSSYGTWDDRRCRPCTTLTNNFFFFRLHQQPLQAAITDHHHEDADSSNDISNPPLSLFLSSSPPLNVAINRNIRLVHLVALFASWYLFNIYFNIFNKQVLKVYPFPLTISAFQFGVGTLLSSLMWATNLSKSPTNISSSQLMGILPLAIAHTLGSLFTNMSLGKVAVSFTHTIKALEPFFTIVLSAMFLGEFPTIWVLFSLVPVVGGVALASLTEVSFNWYGFLSAMASNLANQSRNVLSKKIMVKNEESLDNITLFSIITVISFLMSVPIALIVEGINFTPSHIPSSGGNLREIYMVSILAALCFHGHQQVSYMILARVSPISHSIGNCVKRVVVIVSSVVFFRTPVSLINSLGTGIALAGVFLYSRLKDIKAKAS